MRSCAGPCTWSSCFTATPIRRIRSPAPPASRRSTSTATSACSSARTNSSRARPRRAGAAMSLKGLPNVLDVRCVGLTAGIDLASRPGEVGKRAYDAMDKAFHELDLVVRAAGETLVLTPPLIVSEREIDEMFAKVARVIKAVA